MNESLRGDHPIEQLSSRVSGNLDDRSVRIRSRSVESDRGNRLQYGIETSSSKTRVRRIPIHAAFELDSRDD